MDLLSPPEPPSLPDPRETVDKALRRPLGQPALERFLEPGDRVAVVAPRAGGSEDLRFAVDAVVEAAARARVAAVGVYGTLDEGSPMRAILPGLCALRPVAEADKVVVVARLALDPEAMVVGGARALREAVTAAGSRPPHEPHLPLFVAALPPIFAVEVAFQRGGRPSAVFAGDLPIAHRAARAHVLRWRAVEVDEGYDGIAVELGHPDEAERALRLAARGLVVGGVLVGVGPPVAAPAGLGVDLRFADDLEAARRLLEEIRPGGRLAYLPDPLRALLLRRGDRFPAEEIRVASAP